MKGQNNMNDNLQLVEQKTALPAFTESLFYRFVSYTDVKETTLAGYKVCLRQFVKWLQDNSISQPERSDIKQYKAYLDTQKFTAGTKAQYLRAVKHFFKWAQSEGLYPNIADNIKGAKVAQDNTRKEAFNEDDIRQILESIETDTEAGKRDKAMILLSVTGGLRIIEMQRADVADIQKIKGQTVLFIQGKGHDEKDDYIKIIPEVASLIYEYLAERNAKKTEPLFTGAGNRAKGERLTEPSFSRIIKTRFKAAGYDCDKLTAHSLRHTSNTILFKAGADLYTVQKHARHKDPKTTEIYIHAVDKEKDKSEQTIYNRIFTPGKMDPFAESCEILRGLSEQEQQTALEYLKGLQNGAAYKERVIANVETY